MKNENVNIYKEHTIDELISILENFKKAGLKGTTKVYLSDFEFNGKQTCFEISQVEDEDELFIFYEMHESMW